MREVDRGRGSGVEVAWGAEATAGTEVNEADTGGAGIGEVDEAEESPRSRVSQ